ncbi:hypothetical protein BC829DRAFT_408153 [Chytridium lagenaria]|nr:hypothetical protein BC829DRAFT_408153 [Chytridium lagenaria]
MTLQEILAEVSGKLFAALIDHNTPLNITQDSIVTLRGLRENLSENPVIWKNVDLISVNNLYSSSNPFQSYAEMIQSRMQNPIVAELVSFVITVIRAEETLRFFRMSIDRPQLRWLLFYVLLETHGTSLMPFHMHIAERFHLSNFQILLSRENAKKYLGQKET